AGADNRMAGNDYERTGGNEYGRPSGGTEYGGAAGTEYGDPAPRGAPRGRGARALPSTALPEPEAGRGSAYLSLPPTTKNIEPRIAIRSGTRQPGIRVDSACTFEYDAVRSLSRHGVLSPRETR